MSDGLRDQIRAVADPLIAKGVPEFEVRQEVLSVLGVGIGGGGGGMDPAIPACPYCAANGGGGHGGFCPNGGGWDE